MLRSQGREATIRRLPATGAADLAGVMQSRAGVAALVGGEDALGEETLNALLRAARVPVFLCAA
jgi:hypothetical protein